MRRQTTTVMVTAMLLLSGCGTDLPRTATSTPTPTPVRTSVAATPSPTAAASSSPPAPTQPEVLTSGLEVPWGLAFLPDGSALVGERRSADLYRLLPEGTRTKVGTVPGVADRGEGGLLGLAVAPTYAQDLWVYAFFTTSRDNRLVRFRLTAPTQVEVLLSGIPANSFHDAGRIAFGPDGFLYVTTGDAGKESLAQDRSSLAGKVLRLTPEGRPAPGNPFGTEVWTLGHRDPQGVTFDGDGRVWAAEFGASRYDEINLLASGANYGWPEVEGPGTGGGRFVAPQVTFATSEASPSGLAYAAGSLYLAALRGQRLYVVPVSGGKAGTPVERYRGTYGRLRTVAVEPGGRALWLTTSNCDGRGTCGPEKDRVLRIPL